MNDFFSESNKRYELFECECKKATKKHHNNSQLQNFASDVKKKNKKIARAEKKLVHRHQNLHKELKFSEIKLLRKRTGVFDCNIYYS